MDASKLPWKRGGLTLAGAALATAVALTVPSATAAPGDPGTRGDVTLNDAFTRAADEFGVPRDLLVAVGYGETHLDGHGGEPSHAGGYGVMHLVSNPERRTLERAAQLTGESERALRTDDAANVRGGAALLDELADRAGLDEAERRDTAEWYPVVAHYGGQDDPRLKRLYADAVYTILAKGVTAKSAGEEAVVSAAHRVRPDRGGLETVRPLDGSGDAPGTQSEDYPPAHWVAADAGNYKAGRSAAIDTVVVHVTQGAYAGTISWFQNPAAQVSAHYVVRSSDGDVTQMVRDADTAWHARDANSRSLGIEHEGFVDDPSWFTDAMYRSSAALTKHLCDTHGIPKDRQHIVGHSEVPGNDHTDPGANWDWDHYMALVNG
ncbi:nucleoside transporter [Streptomyces lycii]|uniref:N-acetylmuramoyl-L-alanine amidase n=2 Tax=Streptomyces TaxID=1883 RepID=A0ABQ7FP31_9ACTN|nr:nucleoside transporter [Streptomyces lycii]